MAMTKTEQKLKDLNIDYLIKVSNAIMEDMREKPAEILRHGILSLATAIGISTPEGRNEFHNASRTFQTNETVVMLLNIYYDLARERGLFFYVKNEERQLSNKKDAPPVSH